jgi:hypothetical protein
MGEGFRLFPFWRHMTALVGFPLGTIYNITGITQSVPGTVTLSTVADPNSFAVATGMTVTFSNIRGMIQLNDTRCVVGNFNSDTQTFDMFTMQGFPIDTRNLTPYISGGQINIISYNPPPGQPPGLMYNNQ